MATVYETEVISAAGLCYKIQKRQIYGVWQQRHIWYPPTTGVADTDIQDWISTGVLEPDMDLYHESFTEAA